MLPESSSLYRQQFARIRALPWREFLPWLLVTLAVAPFAFIALRAAWHFTIDDSGISFAYAKHIAEGDGAVAVVGGPRVEGYSNALWVFLLIPFVWLGLPLPLVSKALGVVGLALTLWAGAGLLLRTRPRQPLASLLTTLWALLVVVTLEIAVWTVAGLENALLSALLMSMVYFDAREHDEPTRFPTSAVLAFLLCITRPEGPAYALPLLALKALIAWRVPTLRTQFRRAVFWFAVPLVAYHVVHFAMFREFVPNTYFAKPQSKSLAKGIKYLHQGLEESRLLFMLPLALIGLLGQWRAKIILLWIVVFGAAFVLYSGGDWMPHARFISFFAPALLLLAAFGVYNCALGLMRLLERPTLFGLTSSPQKSHTALTQWVATGFLVLATVSIGFAWQNFQLGRLRKVKQANFCHFCDRLDDSKKLQALSEKAQLGSVSVVTHDFGGPSWLSNDDYYPIDFLGLCDATIPRLRNAKDGLRSNYPLFDHILHEQTNGPGWVYMPRNFWPTFRELAEYELSYIHLNPTQLPHGPRGGFLELHRRELVDFFPPFVLGPGQQIVPGLKLLGSGITSTDPVEAVDATKGAMVRVSVVVSSTPASASGQLGVAFGKEAPSQPIAIDRGLAGVAQHILPGDPLRFDFELPLPSPKGAQYTLRLGYSKAAKGAKPARKDWVYVDLPALAVKAKVLPNARTLSRYPDALPVAVDERLRSLQPRVATLLDTRFGIAVQERDELASQLIERGNELELDEPSQAYLAYVWAAAVQPAAWRLVTKPLLRVRPSLNLADYSLELLLLRDYYRAPSPQAKTRLIDFYLSRQKHTQAAYFGHENRTNGSSSNPTAFELNPETRKSWMGNLQARVVAGDQLAVRTSLPGYAFTSAGPLDKAAKTLPKPKDRHTAQGELLSPSFKLDGHRLSLMIGGGKASDRIGVELLVDDHVVQRGSGISDTDVFPVIWDVSAHLGKQARLRIFDRNPRKSVHIGKIELWK